MHSGDMTINSNRPGRVTSRALAACAVLLLLGGCAQMRERFGTFLPGSWSQGHSASSQQSMSTLQQAVVLLQAGKQDQAQDLLAEILLQDPDNRIARKLMQQITSDPNTMLGTQAKPYTVQRGDTMSELAEQALGDPLMFYVLARYNRIEVPNQLQAGRVIQLPLRSAVDVVSESDEAAVDPLEPSVDALVVALQRAEDAMVLGHSRAAIATLTAEELMPLPGQALDILGEALRRELSLAIQQRNLALAQDTLRLAKSEREARAADWEWLTPLADQLRSHQLIVEGDAMLAKGEDLEALHHYRMALELRPGDEGLVPRIERLASRLSEEFHEAALIQYRNQRLDEAIKNWERALTADPDYDAARVYLTRARELQRRLESLRDQSAS